MAKPLEELLPALELELSPLVYELIVASKKEMNDEGNLGEMSRDGLFMRFREDLEPAIFVRVLLHEIAHDFEMRAIPGAIKQSKAEAFCDAFADYLTSFFARNPDWVKWILKMTSKHNRRT